MGLYILPPVERQARPLRCSRMRRLAEGGLKYTVASAIAAQDVTKPTHPGSRVQGCSRGNAPGLPH